MPNPTQESQREEQELLVCGLCGRVNHVPPVSSTRSQAVRCSGCGVQLRSERSRRLATECPSCHKRLEIEEEWVGQTVRCGACGAGFEAQRAGGTTIPGGHPPARSIRRMESIPVAMPQPAPDPAESPTKIRRRRRKKRKVRSIEVPWGLVAGSLRTFGLVGAVIGFVGKQEGWWLGHPADQAAQDALPAAMVGPGSPLPVMAPSESAALQQVVKGFLACRTFDEQAPYVRFPGEFADKLAAFKGQAVPEPLETVAIKILAEEVREGRLFLRVAATDAGGACKEATVERIAPGRFLVDWDSFVRYATADWAVFAAKCAQQPEKFQVYVRRDVVGHPSYPVEKFKAYQVFWKGVEDGVPLFVPRGSPEDGLLEQATAPLSKAASVEPVQPSVGTGLATLGLFFNAKSGHAGIPPAMELAKFYHIGWVNPARGELASAPASR